MYELLLSCLHAESSIRANQRSWVYFQVFTLCMKSNKTAWKCKNCEVCLSSLCVFLSGMQYISDSFVIKLQLYADEILTTYRRNFYYLPKRYRIVANRGENARNKWFWSAGWKKFRTEMECRNVKGYQAVADGIVITLQGNGRPRFRL